MITLTAEAEAALASSTVNMVQLLLLQFSTPIALNSSNYDFTYGGILYKGAYGMGTISEIDDSPGEIKGMQFTLNSSSSGVISLALSDSKIWQATPVIIRTAILNDDYQIVDAPIVWSGTGDTMSISEGEDSTAVQCTAESSAVDFLRGSVFTYTDTDQKAIHPDDLGFSLLLNQADKPVVWPTKSWFYR